MRRSKKLFTSKPGLTALFLCCTAAATFAADSPQFRGPERSGIYPEKGLLESWPDGGPKRLWITDEILGEGFASVSVAGGRIYTTGMLERRGMVFAFDLDGKLVWRGGYGTEHSSGYPGTRTTPTVHGGRLYLFTSLGTAVALDATSGEVVWEKDLFAKFGGEVPGYGIAESPLVVDGKVIFTPGGKDATVVAMDPGTGEIVWTSKGLSDRSAYCSPQLFDDGEHRQIVTLVKNHMLAVDPANGEVLWTTSVPAQYGIHATAPAFDGSSIYISHGYRQGGKLYELAADRRSVSRKWTEENLDVHHGGAIFIDGHIYGAASSKTWYVLDGATGEIEASIPRLGKGSMIWADGLLYGYVESGDVVLVDPDPDDFRKISSFRIKEGHGHHWAHPAISDGVLYIRHGEILAAYDIAAPPAP